jgi:hypothetical protein
MYLNVIKYIQYWDIRPNDIVKLGRVRIDFTQFEMGEMKAPDDSPDEVEEDSLDDDGECLKCRVCFSRRATTHNPLMRPCACMGSVKYIHYKCL